MITKTHREDRGLGLPETKKKRKKVVKEPETQYSVLNRDNYFTEACPARAKSPSKSAVQGQAPKMPPAKKQQQKGLGPVCAEPLDPEATAWGRRAEESPRPRKPVLGPSESLGREKKKNRKSLRPPGVSPGSSVKSSPDPWPGREVTRVGKKLKKHKKEKRAQEAAAFSAQDPWFCEAGDALHACSLGKPGQGQERKQRSPREHNVKPKKKKKTRQEGDPRLGHPEPPRSAATSPSRKGSRKKPLKVEAADDIPIGDGPKAAAKKKVKSKNKAEQRGAEEPAMRKRRKKSKEDSGAAAPWEEEEPDTDLEVVLEKKGNMDEAHIDQVRRKALQEEIDRESGKTEASERRKCTGTQFGQWDTAGFENEEQKLKFLKLMGGFKNRSPSLSRPRHTTGRPTMALSRKAADSLQQGLQRDYDRAQSWRHRPGAGLGFPSAPSKVFYIDRNASRSIKFED